MPIVAISTATAGWPTSGRSTARSISEREHAEAAERDDEGDPGGRPKVTVPA